MAAASVDTVNSGVYVKKGRDVHSDYALHVRIEICPAALLGAGALTVTGLRFNIPTIVHTEVTTSWYPVNNLKEVDDLAEE